jgi:hypothetical protein
MSGNDPRLSHAAKQIDDLHGQAMLLPPGIKPDRPDRLASILTQGFILCPPRPALTGGLFGGIQPELFTTSRALRFLGERTMMPKRRWTPGEIDRLKGSAGMIPTAQIAQEIGRPVAGVVMKAYELKLSLKVKASDALASSDDTGAADADLTG